MSNVNTNDFFTFTEEEVSVPQQLIFTANDPVKMKILDFQTKKFGDKPPVMIVSCKILSGEHIDKTFSLYLRKGDKGKTLIKFLLAFTNEQALKSNGFQPSSLIGLCFDCVPTVPREWQGKQYQDFRNFAKIDTVAPAAVGSIF